MLQQGAAHGQPAVVLPEGFLTRNSALCHYSFIAPECQIAEGVLHVACAGD